MSRLLLALFLLLAPLLGPSCAAADLHVLIYHRFGEDRYPTTNVAVDRFAEQMAYLQDHDYRVLPLAEVVAALTDHTPLPERAVVITIDDGYASIYTHAWPILRSFGYPFTVFLNVQAVDRHYRNILTWAQIDEMQRAGVDFEDHSYSHHRLGNRPAGMDEEAYRQWISADLRRGEQILGKRLGRPPQFLAIPYGEYNAIVLEEARKIGYTGILTQDPGAVSDDTSPFRIPREAILGFEWATMEHFETVLNRVDLPCTDLVPGLAPFTEQGPVQVSARLLYPDRYLPGSLGIYISELGWLPATLADDRLILNEPVSLTRRLNRVAVSGRDRESGRTAIHFWMLLRSAGN